MEKKPKDRHLDAPAEANRDKHVNFIAQENSEIDPAEEPSTGPMSNDAGSKQRKKEEKNKYKKK